MAGEVVVEHRRGVQVIDRHVEEALNLRGVQVHGQHAVGAGARDEVGHQLGGDRHAALVLAVLPGIAEVRHHRRDAVGAGPLEAVDHDQQLHQVSFTGGQVGCTRKTSRPRTSSSILQEISPSGKLPIEILPGGSPRYSQMRLASSGFARPLKILRSFIGE